MRIALRPPGSAFNAEVLCVGRAALRAVPVAGWIHRLFLGRLGLLYAWLLRPLLHNLRLLRTLLLLLPLLCLLLHSWWNHDIPRCYGIDGMQWFVSGCRLAHQHEGNGDEREVKRHGEQRHQIAFR